MSYLKTILEGLQKGGKSQANLISLPNLTTILHAAAMAQLAAVELVAQLLKTGDLDVNDEIYRTLWQVCDDYQVFMEQELQREESVEGLGELLPSCMASLEHALRATLFHGKISPSWLTFEGPSLGLSIRPGDIRSH